jgi:hypothetical protein
MKNGDIEYQENDVKSPAVCIRQDELVWQEQGVNGIVVHSEEPGSSFTKRLVVTVVSWLPVEWLL